MQKRRLGKSDLMVSVLGLGCMSIGTEESKAQGIIEAALEEGVNYFDTADLYDHGVNEKIVGSTLKQHRDKVIIATKVGNRWNEAKNGWSWDPSKAYIKESVKRSLTRLQTDYIDLYQLHGGTIDDPIDETIEAFEELIVEGYIRHYGISSIRPNVIRQYVEKSSIISVMMQHSILDRRPEGEVFSLLEKNGISVVTRGPLAKGLLSDKLLDKASDAGYLDYRFEELASLLPLLKDVFASRESFTEVALQYNLGHSAVASVIAGASSIEQIRANARAVKSNPLTDSELAKIKDLSKASLYQEHR